MKVVVKDFLNKYASAQYKHGIYIPEDILLKCMALEFKSSSKIVELPDNIFEVIEANKKDAENKDALYEEISSHRLTGYEKEKDDIEGAILEFAKSIEIGETTTMFYAYAHSYERIIILLHKIKDYQREMRYISQYLTHDISDKQKDKYQKRLEKLNSKYGQIL